MHVLVQARLERDGPLPDVNDVGLRDELERSHAGLLRAHGMAHLDISEIRSRNRAVTQAISRGLYEQGAAGLLFRPTSTTAGAWLRLASQAGELARA